MRRETKSRLKREIDFTEDKPSNSIAFKTSDDKRKFLEAASLGLLILRMPQRVGSGYCELRSYSNVDWNLTLHMRNNRGDLKVIGHPENEMTPEEAIVNGFARAGVKI